MRSWHPLRGRGEPVLQSAGACRLEVEGEPMEMWQFRRLVLEPVLFPSGGRDGHDGGGRGGLPGSRLAGARPGNAPPGSSPAIGRAAGGRRPRTGAGARAAGGGRPGLLTGSKRRGRIRREGELSRRRARAHGPDPRVDGRNRRTRLHGARGTLDGLAAPRGCEGGGIPNARSAPGSGR